MIYDCFPFNNELDLLEIRLNHHDPFVDKFIISEALHTYSGEPKPAVFLKFRDHPRFAKFLPKIVHRLYAWPPKEGVNWNFEHEQRDSLRTDFHFKEDDVILYLDCDEILRDASVLEMAKQTRELITLQLKHCWYYFNCVKKPGSAIYKDYSLESVFSDGWIMGKICRREHLTQFPHLYNMREAFLWNKNEHTVKDAGWHFSNAGDPRLTHWKLTTFSHSKELQAKYDLSPELVAQRKKDLVDPLGREGVSFIPTELDVPQFVLDNLDRYKEYILDAPNS